VVSAAARARGGRGVFRGVGRSRVPTVEPKSFLAGDNAVVVLLDAEYTVKATGRRVAYEDAVMIWRFNAAGEVVRFAHRVDFHLAWLAQHD
jgi:hypothetical protein